MADVDDNHWPGPGGRVGPYVIVAKIGTDDWDHDYLADDEGGRVVLRAFPLWGGGDMACLRFEREAGIVVRVLRSLDHPAIRPAYAAGTHGLIGWLAVAPDVGVPLPLWCAARPWNEVLAVLLAVGRALATVEATGIQVRGLCPEDIRVEPDDRVRVDVAVGLVAGLLRGPEAIWPLRYLSPEFLQGRSPSRASTQHLFCVIAWEALYGRPPFAGSSTVEFIMAMLEGRVVDPPPGAAVPKAIRRALERGFAGDSAARWPSMDALLAALTPRRGLLARLFGG